MEASSLSSAFLLSPPGWPPDVLRTTNCDESGLCVGAGTRLVRMVSRDRLAVEADAARCIALLSVLARKPLGPEVLSPIEAAAAYWAAGDKALAKLRLVFSGLPKLRSTADATCLEAAARCLDQGLAPRDLMKALDLDPSVLDLRRHDPDQPRVPAASGRESGRWTANEAGSGTPG